MKFPSGITSLYAAAASSRALPYLFHSAQGRLRKLLALAYQAQKRTLAPGRWCEDKGIHFCLPGAAKQAREKA